ncbi:MAG: histidine phosphatase family protein [Atopobiaceae bacterium]|nr:histidine phosphatase family protein [Atopobiaceae bacterium]
MMELFLMRHGATQGNELHRYVGRGSDEPLSEVGKAQCKEAGACLHARRVYVSPMLRARQTAQICFPHANLIPVPGLEEFDFGCFEGKSAQDMEDDEAYRAWVDGWCTGRCPGGESRAEFVLRTASALEGLLSHAAEREERRVIVVAHGGTIMAALSSFADGSALDDDYFGWQVGCCEGYSCMVSWRDGHLRLEAPQLVLDWTLGRGL